MAIKMKKDATGTAAVSGGVAGANGAGANGSDAAVRAATFDVFRRWGYLQTTLDPLGQYLAKEPFPAELPEGSEDAAAEARGFYCGTIGVEFMHIANAEITPAVAASTVGTVAGADSSRDVKNPISGSIRGWIRRSIGTALPGSRAIELVSQP